MVKTSDIKPQERNKNSFLERVKRAFYRLADNLGAESNPDNPRNIDNPKNEYYGLSKKYWEDRERTEEIDKENAKKTVDALDEYLERQRKKGKVD